MDNHLQHGAAFDLEVRVLHKSGRYEWVRLRAQADFGADRPADLDRGIHAAHHGSQARRAGRHRRQARRRGRESCQEHFPGQRQPRDPHAHERRHRHGADSVGHSSRRHPARVRRCDQRQRQGAVDPHQRRARPVQDRGRPPGLGARALRRARRDLRNDRGHGAAIRAQGHRDSSSESRIRASTCAAIRAGCARSS